MEIGSAVQALLVRPVGPPHHSFCFHSAASSLDYLRGDIFDPIPLLPSPQRPMSPPPPPPRSKDVDPIPVPAVQQVGGYESFSTLLKPSVANVPADKDKDKVATASGAQEGAKKGSGWRTVRTALLTISDRVILF